MCDVTFESEKGGEAMTFSLQQIQSAYRAALKESLRTTKPNVSVDENR
jgi:hypothetical protein